VGQNPPWSINSDNDLERFLDEDYEYFKKAMICESQGYGIAAFAYYRRVVENSINKILETLKVVLEAQNAEPGKIQKIEEALKGTIMDERIRIAKDAVPGSLRPNNINPLGVIYDTLSAGIHRLTEEECLDNSVHIRGSISYLIKMLVKQSEEQKIFLEDMKNLHDFNSSST
jgi:hypothetical protein